MVDSDEIRLGTGDDLKLYHDGSNSYIKDTGTGVLIIESNQLQIKNDAADEKMIVADANGAVELYHDNSKKLNTESWGITVTGDIKIADTKYLLLGDGNDLQIRHDGTHSNIENSTGNLHLRSAANCYIQVGDGSGDWENAVRAYTGGAAELYYDDVKKLATYGDGVTVQGDFWIDNQTNTGKDIWFDESANTFRAYDDVKFTCGNADDFQIYHNGSHSYLAQTGPGSIILDVTSGQGTYIQTNSNSYSNLSLNKSHSNADGVDYFQCRDSSNNLKLHILSTGNVQNANNSYGQTSDSKLKENIVDANSQWEDIKAVKVRNFNFKASTGLETHKQIGVIAQEIESVSAGLVTETVDRDPETQVDLGTKTKSVKYSILYMKAIKALQEAMAKIETLETKVAALEAK